ncbi:50S ribosomal protein L30e [Candidatus Micrarchaeota archaeon]|nr:50S ribosomal protein L30e [Candidatus Micrarchaeota archaeon]
MDIIKAIRLAVDSGKVIVGMRECKRSIINGKGKIVILSKNCPRDAAKDIEYYSNIANIPFLRYDGTSLDLGQVCGYPYPVSVMVVIDEGDSDILNVVNK